MGKWRAYGWQGKWLIRESTCGGMQGGSRSKGTAYAQGESQGWEAINQSNQVVEARRFTHHRGVHAKKADGCHNKSGTRNNRGGGEVQAGIE